MDASLSGVSTRAREWTSQFTLINNLTNETTAGFFEQLICCEAKSPATRNRDEESQQAVDESNPLQSSQSSSGDSHGSAEDVSAAQEDEATDSQDQEALHSDPNAVPGQIPALTVATVVEATPNKTAGENESDTVELPANHLDMAQAVTADGVQATAAADGQFTEPSLASSTEPLVPDANNPNVEASQTVQQVTSANATNLQAPAATEATNARPTTAVEDVVVANTSELEEKQSVVNDQATTTITQAEPTGNAGNSDQSNSRDNQGPLSSRDRNSTRRDRWFERNGASRQVEPVGTGGNAQQKVAASEAQEVGKAASDSLLSSTNSMAGSMNAIPSSELPPPVAVEATSLDPTPALVLPVPSTAAAADVLEIGGTQTAVSSEATIGSTTPVDSSRQASRSDATGSAGNANANTNANDPTNLSQMERVRLVQRVSRSFSRLGPTGGEINLKLHPPQLGSLNVQVRLEGRSLTAKLTTESVAAQEVLMENLPVLRSRLAEQGFEISQFQVDVADSGNMSSTFGDGTGQQNNFRQAREDLDRTVSMRRIHSDRRSMPVAAHQTMESQLTPWRAEQGSGIDVRA